MHRLRFLHFGLDGIGGETPGCIATWHTSSFLVEQLSIELVTGHSVSFRTKSNLLNVSTNSSTL